MYIKEVIINVLDRIDELYHQKIPFLGVNTGFGDVDDILLGLKPSELIVIAGRPSLGKTAFAMNILENISISQAKTVAFFSLELSPENLVMRMITSLGKIPLRILQTGRLSNDDWPKLTRAIDLIRGISVYFSDSPAISLPEICNQCKKMSKGRLDLVIIDDIQLLAMQEKLNGEDAISEIAHKLKLLAVELNIPIVVISQTNRDLEIRENKRPVLSDLRGTGTLANLADKIIFIYRDEIYDEDSNDKGIAEILVKKNRFGAKGTVSVSFMGEYMRFETKHCGVGNR